MNLNFLRIKIMIMVAVLVVHLEPLLTMEDHSEQIQANHNHFKNTETMRVHLVPFEINW